MSDSAVKTVMTGLIALGIIALTIVAFITTRDVPPGIQTVLGIVIMYYFTKGTDESKIAHTQRRKSDE